MGFIHVGVGALEVEHGVVREGLIPNIAPFGQGQSFHPIIGVIYHVSKYIRG